MLKEGREGGRDDAQRSGRVASTGGQQRNEAGLAIYDCTSILLFIFNQQQQRHSLTPPSSLSLSLFHPHAGVLACLDSFMNIAMEQTEEYVHGQLKAKYGDCFIRGNNGTFVCLGGYGRRGGVGGGAA